MEQICVDYNQEIEMKKTYTVLEIAVILGISQRSAYRLCNTTKEFIDVPIGLFKYELRHEDEDGMTPCEVSYQIIVNHFGTILTNKHIKMQHNGWAVFDGNEAFKFLDERLSIKEYKEKYREQGLIKDKNRHR